MVATINADTTNGVVITSDTSGEIELQANGVTKAKITANGLQDANGNSLRGGMYRNLIINGDMRIAQRGTSVSSITTTAYRTVDRFKFGVGSLGTWTMSQDSEVPTGQGFANSVKLQCTSTGSAGTGGALNLQQALEGQMLQHLKKGTANAESLTVSFWVKSNKTGTYIFELYDADNSRTISKAYTISSADTWEKKTITIAGDTTGALDNDNGGSLYLVLWLGAGSDYQSGTLATSWENITAANRVVGQVNLADSTSNYINITGLQLEVGSGSSDFEFLPYDVQLARCQRYYWKLNGTRDLCAAMLASTVSAYGVVTYPVEMRASPSLSPSATTTVRVSWSAGTSVTSGFAVDRNSTTAGLVRLTTSGLTAGQGAWFLVDTGSLSAGAEL